MNDKFREKITEKNTINSDLSKIISSIIDGYEKDCSIDHINKYPLPSKTEIIKIIDDLFDIIYPGYFTEKDINKTNVNYFLGDKISVTFEKLTKEIAKSFRHEKKLEHHSCDFCDECLMRGITVSLELLKQIPIIRKHLYYDLKAAYNGDPAAKSFNEIVFSYPGMYAITVHRIAHELYKNNIPLVPRIMSEYSHSKTGIDIHPGAQIGEYFFIDHGTGVVIGETCVIGKHVKLYQGVTLGALSFPKDEKGILIKGLKRHPTIEDNVTIYAGATILGGDTVIGANSSIGGNVWVIESIPPNSKVTSAESQSKIQIKNYGENNKEN